MERVFGSGFAYFQATGARPHTPQCIAIGRKGGGAIKKVVGCLAERYVCCRRRRSWRSAQQPINESPISAVAAYVRSIIASAVCGQTLPQNGFSWRVALIIEHVSSHNDACCHQNTALLTTGDCSHNRINAVHTLS
jgi:hypothetical protein